MKTNNVPKVARKAPGICIQKPKGRDQFADTVGDGTSKWILTVGDTRVGSSGGPLCKQQ